MFAAAALFSLLVQSAPSDPPVAAPLANAEPAIESGEVVLNCRILRDGKMDDCRVIQETPTGAGFAAEALQAVRGARLSREAVRSARRSSGRVNFRIHFRLGD